MTNVERMKAALEHRPTDGPVPLWEIEFHAWDQASGRHAVFGQEFAALSPQEQEKALHVNTEIMVSVSLELGFSALTCPARRWKVAPDVPAYFWLPDDAREKQARLLRKAAGDRLLLVGNAGGVMGMPSAKDYVEFSYRLFDAPEKVEAAAWNNLEFGLKNARFLRDQGMDAVFTASDIADNRGPFFNPEQLERFIFPCLRQWAAEVKKLGLYSIIHTDGNVAPCLEQIASSGVDALQAVDPTAGMDMRRAQEAARGRLCLCGNIDCGLLLTGPQEAIYESTRKLLAECAGAGPLVLGASNAVVPETPIANYRAMLRAWREHAAVRPKGAPEP